MQAGLAVWLRRLRPGSASVIDTMPGRFRVARRAILLPSRARLPRCRRARAASRRRAEACRLGQHAFNWDIERNVDLLAAVRGLIASAAGGPGWLVTVSGKRRVVLVAPEFPPSNSAGAHRPRLFAKHLPAFGWTADGADDQAGTDRRPAGPDARTAAGSGVDHRANRGDTHQAASADRRSGPSIVARARPSADLDDQTGKHRRAGAVRSTMVFVRARSDDEPPLRRPLRRGLHRPMDHRVERHASFPEKAWFYHRAAAAIEPGVLRSAAHVTAVSEGILEDLRGRYPWLEAGRMSAMPYGAEPDDLEAAVRLGLTPPDFSGDDEDVTISFTGAVQPTSQALVTAVLRALGALDESRPATRRRIRLRAYGTSNLTWGHGRHTILPMARELGVDHLVSEIPERIPYLQAMSVLQASGIVLVMGSTDAYYHASKLYPAIVSGRPILAICHRDSSIKRVVEQTGAGMCVTFGDPLELQSRVGEIASAIESLAGRPRRKPDAAAIEPFTARASTARLARVLDHVTDRPALAEAI